MVFILKTNKASKNHQILQQEPMKTNLSVNKEEYDYSSNLLYNNNVTQARHRVPKPKTNLHKVEQLPTDTHGLIYQQDYQISNKHKNHGAKTHSNMNANGFRGDNAIEPQLIPSTEDTNFSTTDICHSLQSEFRRRGWNVAGANLLAVSCWIAKTQFLYARPRLTGIDFGIAAIITAACGIIVR